VAIVHDTLRVDGIHCIRCIETIGSALADIDGLVAGSSTLTGEIHLAYDDADAAVPTRVAAALTHAGFAVRPAA
jgi:hypothetical protein